MFLHAAAARIYARAPRDFPDSRPVAFVQPPVPDVQGPTQLAPSRRTTPVFTTLLAGRSAKAHALLG